MGAQPGSVPGITRVDKADLMAGMRPFLGTDGPAWSPEYDVSQGVSVLVVTVEPPQPGDRMQTLRQELTITNPAGREKTYLAGTVFVRRGASTEQPDPGEIRGLEDRRAEAGELERLKEMSDLAIEIQFKVAPFSDSRETHRYPEQRKLQFIIAQIGHLKAQAELPETVTLAGAGQGFEVFAAATQAINEIEVAAARLAAARR